MERKIIVVSDSHGVITNLSKVFDMHRDADAFIHLGDGAREFDALCRQREAVGYSLLGNCDLAFMCPGAQTPHAIYTIGGKRFFMTHGNTYGVKSNRETLISIAKKKAPDVDIILYGHTHIPENKYLSPEGNSDKGIYIINPGSISCPRDLNRPSYALILIKGDSIITNVAYL